MKKNLALTIIFGLFSFANSAHAVLIGDNAGNLIDLDVTTNTSTLIGNGGVVMFDIAMDPLSGNLYGVSGSGYLYNINYTNGAVTAIGYTGGVNGLTFNNSGTLFGTGGSRLYTINTTTGSSSLVGNTGYSSSGDIAFDNSGTLFMSATGSGGDLLVTLDPNTGAGTLLGNTGYAGVYGLNYSNSTLYGFTLGGATLALDRLTGAGTFISFNGIHTNGADGVGGVTTTGVPESSSVILMLLGLAGLTLTRRKQLQN